MERFFRSLRCRVCVTCAGVPRACSFAVGGCRAALAAPGPAGRGPQFRAFKCRPSAVWPGARCRPGNARCAPCVRPAAGASTGVVFSLALVCGRPC